MWVTEIPSRSPAAVITRGTYEDIVSISGRYRRA